MNCYTIQIYLKNACMLDFVILDIEDLYLKSQNMVSIVYNMVGIVYNHEIFQHI